MVAQAAADHPADHRVVGTVVVGPVMNALVVQWKPAELRVKRQTIR